MELNKNSINLRHKKILVTGGSGFLGKFIIKELLRRGAKDIIIPRSRECDLRKRHNCIKVTKGVDLIIHLAGNVGGIGKNRELPGTLFYDNAVMGIELL